MLAEVNRQGLKLVAVLPTHWHFDHVGGNKDLARAVPGFRVYGARGEGGRIPAMTDEVDDGDTVTVGSIRGRVIGIPAHTNGHVAYYFPAAQRGVYRRHVIHRRMRPCVRGQGGHDGGFVGQARGVARLHAGLLRPRVHREKSAVRADAASPTTRRSRPRTNGCASRAAEGKFTVPSTIGDEKQFNPFLRTDSAELRASLRKIDPSVGDEPVAYFRQDARAERPFLTRLKPASIARASLRDGPRRRPRLRRRTAHPASGRRAGCRPCARYRRREARPPR